MRTPAINWGELDAIVGTRNVRPAMSDESVLGVRPAYVTDPGTPEEVACVLAWANANGVRVLPRGNGTKLEWGNAPTAADLVLSLRRMNRVLEHAWADMTATVEAGCTVQRLQQTLADHGQRLAIDVLWPERATIGGILATNDSGALRLRFGSLRDLVIGITVALPDGTLARSGGKVVKNVAGYDLPKLMTGALGTLGVITQAIFRLHPLPQQTRTVTFVAPIWDEANRCMLRVQDSQMAHVAMQMRAGDVESHSPFEKRAAPVLSEGQVLVDVCFEGTEGGIEAQAAHVRRLAGGLSEPVPERDGWTAREELWRGDEPSLIAKISVLPAEIAAATKVIADECRAARLRWRVVAQATGLMILRLEGGTTDAQFHDALVHTALRLRRSLTSISGAAPFPVAERAKALDGANSRSLIVLHRPEGASVRIDTWGDPGDALPLMTRVKQQFDPKGTLNRGRFVGDI